MDILVCPEAGGLLHTMVTKGVVLKDHDLHVTFDVNENHPIRNDDDFEHLS